MEEEDDTSFEKFLSDFTYSYCHTPIFSSWGFNLAVEAVPFVYPATESTSHLLWYVCDHKLVFLSVSLYFLDASSYLSSFALELSLSKPP